MKHAAKPKRDANTLTANLAVLSQPFRITPTDSLSSRVHTDMLHGMNPEFAPLLKLGRAERLQLVEDLWDSIAQENNLPPVSAVKTDELRRRKLDFAQNPDSGRSWEAVKSRARSEHG